MSVASRHIALICPPFAAHLHTFRALGEELVRRGHRVTFVLNAGAPERIGDLAVRHVPVRPRDPRVEQVLANAESPAGLTGTLRTIAESAALTDQLFAGGLDLLGEMSVDAVIADQLEPAGGLLGRALGVPVISLACALPINSAPGVPLPFLDWPYTPHRAGRLRRTQKIGDLLSWRQRRVLERWSSRFALPACRTLEDCLGPVQIAQVVRGYDFPRPDPLPFAPVGPIRSPEEEGPAGLPFAPDAGRPLVFATMGTLQGGRLELWQAIVRACRDAGTQIVIAHGGKLTDAEAAALRADYAAAFLSYRSVLRRADLCLTHGGSNTVLDALACGVPLVVRPIAFDQPGNLARIVHHGLGERMAPITRPDLLGAQIKRMLMDKRCRENARKMAGEIAGAGGRTRAADLVEAAL
ncbi:glycosyltransferase [Sphingomonas arenae]|uniref:glycosyltransferase n=1 Tax=Sphingomonas arenae TaxID=2812555 RepID=UPI001968599F|nr:glycosyltransferase [Sphingomonas arenae]